MKYLAILNTPSTERSLRKSYLTYLHNGQHILMHMKWDRALGCPHKTLALRCKIFLHSSGIFENLLFKQPYKVEFLGTSAVRTTNVFKALTRTHNTWVCKQQWNIWVGNGSLEESLGKRGIIFFQKDVYYIFLLKSSACEKEEDICSSVVPEISILFF